MKNENKALCFLLDNFERVHFDAQKKDDHKSAVIGLISGHGTCECGNCGAVGVVSGSREALIKLFSSYLISEGDAALHIFGLAIKKAIDFSERATGESLDDNQGPKND